MSQSPQITRSRKNIPCLILIGMPGAGKTTIGSALAERLHWPYLDSDHVIEATYGRRLQDVVDATDKEGFLDIEATIVTAIRAQRCVIGTGGSVVYREHAMRHLKDLGTIIHLDVPLDILVERIRENPERGIAIGPGQTMEDIYAEREQLYRQWSDITCKNSTMSVEECVDRILAQLPPLEQDS